MLDLAVQDVWKKKKKKRENTDTCGHQGKGEGVPSVTGASGRDHS